MKKRLASLLLAVMCLGLLAGCAAQTDEDVIVVGMEISADGVFEARDAQGNPWGVSVQLVEDFERISARRSRSKISPGTASFPPWRRERST